MLRLMSELLNPAINEPGQFVAGALESGIAGLLLARGRTKFLVHSESMTLPTLGSLATRIPKYTTCYTW